MLVSSGGEEGDALSVAKVLLLFQLSIREKSESREYAFLPYMEGIKPKDTVDETLV